MQTVLRLLKTFNIDFLSVFAIVLSVFGFESSAIARCTGLPDQTYSFCIGLERAESQMTCGVLLGDKLAHTVCRMLSQWTDKNGLLKISSTLWDGAEKSQYDSLMAGLSHETNPFPTNVTATHFYEFGRYIQGNHQGLYKQKWNNNILNFVNREYPILYRSESEKVKQLTLGIVKALEETKLFESVPLAEVTRYAVHLVKFVERIKMNVSVESRRTGQPIRIPMGHKLALENDRGRVNPDELVCPSTLYFFDDYGIVVDLSSLLLADKKYDLPLLGSGGFKRVSAALNYNTGKVLAKLSVRRSSNNGTKWLESAYRDAYKEVRTRAKWDSLAVGLDEYTRPHIFTSDGLPSEVSFFDKYSEFNVRKFEKAIIKNSNIKSINGFSKNLVKLRITVQLLAQLKQMHAQKIHHRDLNPNNILIKWNFRGLPEAKIIDAGLALELRRSLPQRGKEDSCAGTFPYFSPEYARGINEVSCQDANFDLKNDIWSMGLVLAEFWSGQRVKSPVNVREIALIDSYERMSKAYQLPHLESEPSSDSVDKLIYRMLDPGPNRIAAHEALEMAQTLLNVASRGFENNFLFSLDQD